MARLFEATRPLVLDDDDWDPLVVLPTLQTHLQLGAHAMGQTMAGLLDQYGHAGGERAEDACVPDAVGDSGGDKGEQWRQRHRARCSAGRGAR